MTLTYDFLESAIHVSYSNKKNPNEPALQEACQFPVIKVPPLAVNEQLIVFV